MSPRVEAEGVGEDERGERRAARRRRRGTRRAGGCGDSSCACASGARSSRRRSASISSPNRSRPKRSACARMAAGVETMRRSPSAIASAKALRRRVVDEQAGRRRTRRFRAAPPRPSATTGRPQACASSGTMPKSSSPGRARRRGAPVEVADLVVRKPARETHARPSARRARARRRSGPSPTIFSGTPARSAGLDGDVDPLVGHERRHDQARSVSGGVPSGRKNSVSTGGYTTVASRL